MKIHSLLGITKVPGEGEYLTFRHSHDEAVGELDKDEFLFVHCTDGLRWNDWNGINDEGS